VKAPALPTVRRSIDEIVADITAELGLDIEAAARAYIGVGGILEKLGPATGNRRANAKLARELLKWIERGKKLFERFEGGDLLVFFGPPGPISTPEYLGLATRQAEARRDVWVDTLREQCQSIIQEQIGEHGGVEHMQRAAAISAAALCRQAGKPLAWASPISSFRMVAGLIFEAMTGYHGAELQRACEFAASRTTQHKVLQKTTFHD
jgi:hypothetical protein